MSDFLGWGKVSEIINQTLEANDRLNDSQKASVKSILARIESSGVIIADEVGMGKTRIAVEFIQAVKKAKGRTAIIVPTTLGFQWQKELNERENDLAPKHTINSLWRFMKAWADEANLEHWDEQSVLLVSQNFANWRIGGQSDPRRWALLPEVYAMWRKHETKALPKGYHSHEDLKYLDAENCARRIVKTVMALPTNHPCRDVLNNITQSFNWGMSSFGGDKFTSGNDYRELLENAVGLGLGSFDLVVIDEAHKSRGDTSSLSRVLERVIIQNPQGRRLAMTATPVELDSTQWKQILHRIQLTEDIQKPILASVEDYASSVSKLRKFWKTDELVRNDFKQAARSFETALRPYLLRRDKRQDTTIKAFHEISNQPINAYRKQTEVAIEVGELSEQWKRIVCSVEGLSAASSMQQDSVSKRARLTLANGHGVAGIIDAESSREESDEVLEVENVAVDSKKMQRSLWWKKQITQAYRNGDESLYQHPAILKIVEEIEKNLSNGQKALVFGKLTKPMRILVKLLNAREMLRRLEQDEFWPQTKVHDGNNVDDSDSEVQAVIFAAKQLDINLDLNEINVRLEKQYERRSSQIEKAKQNLIKNIESVENQLDPRSKSLLHAFKSAAESEEANTSSILSLVTRAIYELSDSNDFKLIPQEVAQGFVDLMGAVTAENEGDEDGDVNLNTSEAKLLWFEIQSRIEEEFGHVKGGMARLMFGGTSASSRRMLQLGFNRKNSFPNVLVAQSVVGREGLNLHQACRIVYLLHPEWNPGVVEQQIGRVDRLGSRWEKEFNEMLASQVEPSELPFIEVKPIVFKGTYDEYNWQVLKMRWDDLRSQLHGVVIPETERDEAFSELYDELCAAAPDFSPQ
ncbi:DEAD/DEAH box helicase family protein [Shewanella baltica]|uniref:DEAD/DEAH box helicase n=1 Tax=Shewanella baltica TaxID=62322 RepID=UPI003D095179